MTSERMENGLPQSNGAVQENGKRRKLHGRAFYESIGSPKIVLAPMVDQSEFAWRMLSRSFLPPSSQNALLAYTPMFHSRLFCEKSNYRDAHFQPLHSTIPSPPDNYYTSQISEKERYLDGNPAFDRPLTVQFCSNDPEDFLTAAKHVAPFCDAVDLNLGCPQGIAKRGKYGAFLQEQPTLIANMVRKLHEELDVPVTAKMRVLETREQTLEYAKTILDAGASIITVHGRRREQKGHNTGLADWSMIRYLRENLPKDTVIFANGNILQHEDIAACLEATGADAVMSAEGNLYDPTIFAPPLPLGQETREYWRGRDGKGGYRVDAVMRRYMDIIHKYALQHDPPERAPLWMPGDPEPAPEQNGVKADGEEEEGPPRKKRKQMLKNKDDKNDKKKEKTTNPNLTAMQAHLFHLLRPLVSQHHNVRDALARSKVGDIDAFEHVLALVERAVKQGIMEYEAEQANGQELGQQQNSSAASRNTSASKDSSAPGGTWMPPPPPSSTDEKATSDSAPAPEYLDPYESSLATVARCKRPYWVCQPYVRPLPKEALERGSMTLSRKEKRRLEVEAEMARQGGDGGRGKEAEQRSDDAQQERVKVNGMIIASEHVESRNADQSVRKGEEGEVEERAEQRKEELVSG